LLVEKHGRMIVVSSKMHKWTVCTINF
jgi:hypothetical protein